MKPKFFNGFFLKARNSVLVCFGLKTDWISSELMMLVKSELDILALGSLYPFFCSDS
eukprot:CAMPEP_0171483676 /NCGR_PEP_ID=MMETSP0946-20130122/8336_1 /TAXON_ID=109269 /ORGANISM="Vaucheria litorea, Strain CCMP2940" /LENGTH=56 /DNA_ID=CAMNT_0012016191 /DNA_START=96 /DNA_END=262 /DNA_ORIENTATION=-